MLCCQCNVLDGTITMNCNSHPVEKRYCAACWDKLEHKEICIEEECNKIINPKTKTYKIRSCYEIIHYSKNTEETFSVFFSLFIITLWILTFAYSITDIDNHPNNNILKFNPLFRSLLNIIILLLLIGYAIYREERKNKLDSYYVTKIVYHVFIQYCLQILSSIFLLLFSEYYTIIMYFYLIVPIFMDMRILVILFKPISVDIQTFWYYLYDSMFGWLIKEDVTYDFLNNDVSSA